MNYCDLFKYFHYFWHSESVLLLSKFIIVQEIQDLKDFICYNGYYFSAQLFTNSSIQSSYAWRSRTKRLIRYNYSSYVTHSFIFRYYNCIYLANVATGEGHSTTYRFSYPWADSGTLDERTLLYSHWANNWSFKELY